MLPEIELLNLRQFLLIYLFTPIDCNLMTLLETHHFCVGKILQPH